MGAGFGPRVRMGQAPGLAGKIQHPRRVRQQTHESAGIRVHIGLQGSSASGEEPAGPAARERRTVPPISEPEFMTGGGYAAPPEAAC